MSGYIVDEDQLGHQVDAWLTALRAQGVSAKRLGELARLLGEATRDSGPRTLAQQLALQRFDDWLTAAADLAHIPGNPHGHPKGRDAGTPDHVRER